MKDLNVGDVCTIRLPWIGCAQCANLQGRQCTIKDYLPLAARLGCGGTKELGGFYLCDVEGLLLPAALHRSELEKKPPKANDQGEPRTDFTPAEGDFVDELQKSLGKKPVTP